MLKKVRDVLIVVVLAGLVCAVIVYVASDMQQYNVSVNVTVGQAMRACEEDGMICSFSSVKSAQDYLNSPQHLAKAKAREAASH